MVFRKRRSLSSIRSVPSLLTIGLVVALSACGGGAGGVQSGSSSSATAPSAVPPPPAAYALSVSLSGSGTVSSAPSGISCGADCTQEYADGTPVTLSASAASGYTFAGWSGSGIACSGTGACTVSMTQARAVTATFSPVAASTFTLQVNRSGSGTVTSAPAGINCGADCSETYTSGTSVTLTATPAAGNTFSGWNGGGCSGTGSCTVSMTVARTTTATFVASTQALNVSVTGAGSVGSSPAGISCGADCSESYNTGTSVTLTATPASGNTFSGWSGSGCSGTGTCTVTMSAARSVTATFAATPTFALNVSLVGSGSVGSSPAGISCGADCSETYTSGTSVTLSATPANGYIFGGWGGACAGTSASCTIAMTVARSVTATFTASASASTYQVSWDAVVDSRVTGYKLYYSTTPFSNGGTSQIVNVGNTTSYTFSPATAGISVGTTVYFGVAAVGSGIESPMSSAVSAVIQ